jgi:tetratricopeptide (TPR) repeat protein
MKTTRMMDVTRTRFARRSRTLLLAVACALGAVLCAAGPALALRNVPPGSVAPGFTLTDVGGAQKSLADFAGKAKLVLIVSGNDRSKKLLGEVLPLSDKYKAEGLEVFAIYTGSDKNEAKAMAEAAKVTYPVLLDSDKVVYGGWGLSVTPIIAFLDKDDKLLKEQPYVPLLSGILDIEIRVALGKLTREEADLALKPEEAPVASDAEKAADKEYNLGMVLLERGLKDKAVEKFKKVLEIDPAYCNVRLQLGQIYFAEGKVDEAKAEFEYVLKCDPSSTEAKVGMGTVLAAKGDLDKAIEIIQSSLQLNPRAELAHYELGKIYEKKGQLDKAVESYKKALEKLLSK